MVLYYIGEGHTLKIVSGITIIVLLLAGIADASTLTVKGSGGADYTKIQDAIDNASAGDTILVYSGTYYENVNINKQLILKGIDDIGKKPVVNAEGNGNALTLNAGNSTLEDISFVNASSDNGIRVTSSDNILRNNSASNNRIGIFLGSLANISNNNTLDNNSANSNNWSGIYLLGTRNNILEENTANSNNFGGIILFDSEKNSLTNNIINSNSIGILIQDFIYPTINNTLTNNTIKSNEYGMKIYSSKMSSMHSSSGNLIYNNYFNNTNNAYDDGNNIWNTRRTPGTNIINGSHLGGNYWSDYSGNDIDGDRLGDTLLPYNSSGNITNGGDYLPLVLSLTNQPPVADYIYSPLNPVVNQNITFDASSSYDPDGNITGYWWNISGNIFTTQIVSISFPFTESFHAGLVVTDNKGATNHTHKLINFTAIMPVPSLTGSISGMKFNDLNNNSIRDTGEPGLAGWTIALTMPGGSFVTGATDANGNYTFNNLTRGNYTVAEILKPDWIQTFPDLPGIHNITLATGENVTGIDFGNNIRSLPSGLNATREIEKESVQTGESTNVTVRINSNVTQALALEESIPAGWNLTRISDDADIFKNSTYEWVMSNVTQRITKTVIYSITVPSDAVIGTFYINGTIVNSSGVIAVVGGNNMITLNTLDIYGYYRSLGSNPDKIETTDLLKAMDDRRIGIAPEGFARPITIQELSALIDEWVMT